MLQTVTKFEQNSSQTLEKQKSRITDGIKVYQPGDPVPPEGTSTSTTAPSSINHTTLLIPLPAIIGIAVGAVVLIALLGALFFFVGRSKTLKEEAKRRQATVARQAFPSSPQSPSHSQSHPLYYDIPPMSPATFTDSNSVLPGYEKAPEYHQDPYPNSNLSHSPRIETNEAEYLRSSTVSPRVESWRGFDGGGAVELDTFGGRH
jgi:hypothetical protein